MFGLRGTQIGAQKTVLRLKTVLLRKMRAGVVIQPQILQLLTKLGLQRVLLISGLDSLSLSSHGAHVQPR